MVEYEDARREAPLRTAECATERLSAAAAPIPAQAGITRRDSVLQRNRPL